MKLMILTVATVAAFVAATPAGASEQIVTLHVDNMYCALCPAIVKKSLGKVPGVTQIDLSFEQQSAVVRFDDTKARVDQLVDATTKAGYPSRVAP
jgi:mercuric ion binding protein